MSVPLERAPRMMIRISKKGLAIYFLQETGLLLHIKRLSQEEETVVVVVVFLLQKERRCIVIVAAAPFRGCRRPADGMSQQRVVAVVLVALDAGTKRAAHTGRTGNGTRLETVLGKRRRPIRRFHRRQGITGDMVAAAAAAAAAVYR